MNNITIDLDKIPVIIDDEKIKELYGGDYKKALEDVLKNERNLAIKNVALEQNKKKQKEVLDKIRKNNERIIDYGFDYDGFNKEEDLKKLIDMLVDYAKQNDKLLEKIE